MIKEALQYILDLKKPEIVVVDGRNYAIENIKAVQEPIPNTLVVTNLTSLVEYIKSNVDLCELPLIVHVCNPTRVELRSTLFGQFQQRKNYINAEAQIPEFRFGHWYDQEQFIIAMQSKFLLNDHLIALLSVVGTLSDGAVKTYGDDGVSQTVTAKTGLARVSEVSVPNPVILAPYRTFAEVDQPLSKFIFRMKSGREMPDMALFEADGGAWRNVAMDNIRGYLEGTLFDLTKEQKIVILS